MEPLTITTTEMHTGGMPLRIIESGFPRVPGNTVLEKRRYVRDNLDHIRKLCMFEPRGHADMFGVFLVHVEGADIGCIFIDTEKYGTMCGHGIISLGRYVIDKKIIANPVTPETTVTFQCPCGPVTAFVEYSNGQTGRVRFHSVPSFLLAQDVTVDVPGYGSVTLDISYGGAFYALVPAKAVGLDVRTSPVSELQRAADAIKQAAKAAVPLAHPESPDLAFLYGTILTDGNDAWAPEETANMCVFADKEVDRSPCGSGVTSRVAMQFRRGLIKLGQTRTFRGPAGSTFTASPVKEVDFGPHKAVVVEVAGMGHYTGSATYTLEKGDDIGKGFLLR